MLPKIKRTQLIRGTISVSQFIKFKDELKTSPFYSYNGAIWASVFHNYRGRTLLPGILLISFICDTFVSTLFLKHLTLFEIETRKKSIAFEIAGLQDQNEMDTNHYVNLHAELEDLDIKQGLLLEFEPELS